MTNKEKAWRATGRALPLGNDAQVEANCTFPEDQLKEHKSPQPLGIRMPFLHGIPGQERATGADEGLPDS